MTPTVTPELVAALKRLRLGRIAETLPDRMVLADKQDMAFDDLLLLIITDEINRRDATAAANRSHAAGLDPSMTLEQFDKTAKIAFDKRMLSELTSLRFVDAHRHVVVLGPVGVGKTFLASALTHKACQEGFSARYLRRGGVKNRPFVHQPFNPRAPAICFGSRISSLTLGVGDFSIPRALRCRPGPRSG